MQGHANRPKGEPCIFPSSGILLVATVGIGDFLRPGRGSDPRASCSPVRRPFRPAICGRNTPLFQNGRLLFFFVEIIQLVAVNVDDEAQHIVGQCRKPCRIVSQQVEYFRHFALGLGTDIDRRAITAIHRTRRTCVRNPEARSFTPESGRLLSSSRLGVDVCFLSSRCRYSGYRFRCVPSGVSVSSSSGSGILRTTFESRGLSGDHLTHQLLVDFDTGMFRRIGCRFVCFFQ